MPAYTFSASGEKDTDELAARIAALAGPGTVITLDGDLGAGKTRFSQGFARAIGVAHTVNSPTFTIIKEYEGSELPFYHMDVYRLTSSDAESLGLDDYFFGEGVTLVEWSQLIAELLPDDRLEVRIGRATGVDTSDSQRLFTLIPHGEPYGRWCEELHKNGWIV